MHDLERMQGWPATSYSHETQSTPWNARIPDDGVPLTVCNVCIVCEEDGVVRHHWVTGRQNTSSHIADAVQNPVVHQEVVHQQLYTQTDVQIVLLEVQKKREWEILSSSQQTETYPKLLYSSLWCLGVVPQFDHGHSHWVVEDDIHAVHLCGNNKNIQCKCNKLWSVNWLQCGYLFSLLTLTQTLTSPGSTGASHICLPSWVLLTPSINLSGVLTSPLTLSSMFTLSGKAAMSGG